MELQDTNNNHRCYRKNDDEDNGESKIASAMNDGRIVPWQHQIPANRIYRVSRASGGKDRHSKVYTSKGLRDRRIRLSVSTAIQFYDLQDRLGYDQPSKAIEWLLKAADSAINDLPEIDIFPGGPYGEDRQMVENEADVNLNSFTNNQQLTATKSGCSSTSETSKGSVLSLSSRKRGGAARDKEREESNNSHYTQSLPSALNSPTSFTELLTGSGGSSNGGPSVAAMAAAADNSSNNCNSFQKPASTANYFSYSQQSPFAMPFGIAGAATAMQHQFSFMQDSNLGDYNLNFSMSSSGLAGFSRGTLQSNSQPQLSHHHNQIQRLSSATDGANNLPFFFGATSAAPAASAMVENQFLTGLDGRLLCYGDGFRHNSDMKGKGKGKGKG